MVYVDVFVAGVGKWYEFKCEETALIRDIIKEIYDVIRDKESIICEKQIDLELYLACIENKRILPLDFKLEESGVENGNRLIESKVVLNPNVRLEECVVNNGNRLILF